MQTCDKSSPDNSLRVLDMLQDAIKNLPGNSSRLTALQATRSGFEAVRRSDRRLPYLLSSKSKKTQIWGNTNHFDDCAGGGDGRQKGSKWVQLTQGICSWRSHNTLHHFTPPAIKMKHILMTFLLNPTFYMPTRQLSSSFLSICAHFSSSSAVHLAALNHC